MDEPDWSPREMTHGEVAYNSWLWQPYDDFSFVSIALV